MKRIEHKIEALLFESMSELETSDKELLEEAIKISKTAYAPYSRFHVGAALRLDDGQIVLGNNQENVAYPSGTCAERTAFYYAGANYPNKKIKTVAIHAFAKDFKVQSPISPCGSCRQAMVEYENNQENRIKVILMGAEGDIMIIESVADLLPFLFNEVGLKKD